MREAPSDDPAADAETFRFTLPGRLIYRDAARAFLSFVCGQLSENARLSRDESHHVISAFVEAFNNAVIHGYGPQRIGTVEIVLCVERQQLVLQVIDHGVAFVAEQVPEPDLGALPEGGMGMFIMRGFMDEVHYERLGDRNVLTMSKSLNPAA